MAARATSSSSSQRHYFPPGFERQDLLAAQAARISLLTANIDYYLTIISKEKEEKKAALSDLNLSRQKFAHTTELLDEKIKEQNQEIKQLTRRIKKLDDQIKTQKQKIKQVMMDNKMLINQCRRLHRANATLRNST